MLIRKGRQELLLPTLISMTTSPAAAPICCWAPEGVWGGLGTPATKVLLTVLGGGQRIPARLRIATAAQQHGELTAPALPRKVLPALLGHPRLPGRSSPPSLEAPKPPCLAPAADTQRRAAATETLEGT
jgi:hypothetical protein